MITKPIEWTVKNGIFPPGTVAGNWLVEVGGQSVSVAEPQVVTFDLEAGTYTATVSRLDADGLVLASASASFVLTEPELVTISIPDNVLA